MGHGVLFKIDFEKAYDKVKGSFGTREFHRNFTG
jgi:hypothetical protein